MRTQFFCFAVLLGFLAKSHGAGELDDYIAKEDGALAYELHGETKILGARAITFRLTSQNWRGLEWKHWLSVIIPAKVDPHKKGVLVITGGSSKSKAPDARSKEAIMFANSANQLRAPIALLGQVPNQPLFDGLKEDDLIAHTFKQYLDGGGDTWPALLPMTKSATRAMDVLTALAKDGKLKTAGGGVVNWENFVVTGGSKRGWTTYLTAAVDKRVCAMAPMVIDMLDMAAQTENQLRSYGGYSDMIKPYTKRGIQKRFRTPAGVKLNSIVDPLSYAARYQMPKLLLLGTNDPYWCADSAGLYFGKLPSQKSLFYLPNAGHGLGLAALTTLNAFFAAEFDGQSLPELSHQRDGDKLGVSWVGASTKVEVWSASSTDRDFREAKWSAQELESGVVPSVGSSEGMQSATAALKAPASGWSAHFIRVTFPALREGMGEFKLATPIVVLPETYPHELATP